MVLKLIRNVYRLPLGIATMAAAGNGPNPGFGDNFANIFRPTGKVIGSVGKLISGDYSGAANYLGQMITKIPADAVGTFNSLLQDPIYTAAVVAGLGFLFGWKNQLKLPFYNKDLFKKGAGGPGGQPPGAFNKRGKFGWDLGRGIKKPAFVAATIYALGMSYNAANNFFDGALERYTMKIDNKKQAITRALSQEDLTIKERKKLERQFQYNENSREGLEIADNAVNKTVNTVKKMLGIGGYFAKKGTGPAKDAGKYLKTQSDSTNQMFSDIYTDNKPKVTDFYENKVKPEADSFYQGAKEKVDVLLQRANRRAGQEVQRRTNEYIERRTDSARHRRNSYNSRNRR